jgi:hypothetical protein
VPCGWGRKGEPEALDTSALDAFRQALPGDPGSNGPAHGWTPKDTRDLPGRDFPLFTAFFARPARSSVGGGALRFLLRATNRRSLLYQDDPSKSDRPVLLEPWLSVIGG